MYFTLQLFFLLFSDEKTEAEGPYYHSPTDWQGEGM